MSRRRSITRRLILALTAAIVVFWGVTAAALTYVFSEELNETFDLSLREAADRLLPLAIDDVTDRNDGAARPSPPTRPGGVAYLTYQVRNGDGTILVATPPPPEAPDGLYDAGISRGYRSVGGFRTYTDTDPRTGISITLAETTAHRSEAIGDTTRTLFWPLVALVPLSALVIWLAVVGSLSPVRQLRNQIALRGGSNLSALDVSGQPEELRPIAEATARLVDRLRAAVEAERAFAANSAHELRTPVAGALAQTQRLITELADGPGSERARQIETSLKKLARLSEKLLQLSRVDAGLATADADTDLRPVLDLVVNDFARELRDEHRISYRRGADADLFASMDAEAFAIAMRNLIDNAIKHGPAGGQIEVAVAPGTVHVRSGGPAVADDILGRLGQRFARGASAAEGTGLGLALVDTIARQAGGRLELISPVEGQADGFEARLSVNPVRG